MEEESLITFLKPYEKWVIRFEEVILFRRKLLAIGLLLIVWSNFAFAYSIKAGFFSSLCLLFCTIYVGVVLYAYSGHRIEAALFPPLPKDVKIYSLKEISDFLSAFQTQRKTDKKVIEKISSKKAIFTGVVLIGIAIFFKFVPPFWFNLFAFNVLFFAPKLTEMYYLRRKAQQQENNKDHKQNEKSNNDTNESKQTKDNQKENNTNNDNNENNNYTSENTDNKEENTNTNNSTLNEANENKNEENESNPPESQNPENSTN